MSRRRKSAVDFMLLLLMVIIIAAIVLVGDFIANYFGIVYKVISIKGTLHIFMVNDDIGTELVSLLNAKTTDVKHIELLGRYVAEGIAEERSSRLNPLQKTMDEAYRGYDFTFTAAGSSVKFSKNVPETLTDETRKVILNCPTSFQEVPEELKKKIENNGKLKWPSDSKEITSGFGGRDLGDRKCDCHGGIDIAGKEVDVYAAAPGKVVFAGSYGGYGNLVVIGHPIPGLVSAGKPEKYDYYTFYAHLSSINVKVGDEIPVAGKNGRIIGKSGNTGFTVGQTGYHLHFEVGTEKFPSDKTAINPCLFLDLTGVSGSCEHKEVAACKYVSGIIEGKSVRSYETDIPLPGAKSGNVRGKITFKQWD
ncbi:MAG: M23 family metallopeptidase [Candidatus Aenigmatarchaeota archaeon]